MNEELVLKMAQPSIKNGELTYALFDRIYGMLSLREQYQVCEILSKNNIQLLDSFEDNNDELDSIEMINTEEPSPSSDDENLKPLFDDNIFKDTRIPNEYVFYYKDIKQSNETLIQLVKEGNQQAKQDICIKNEGLVRKYANLYYRFLGNDLEFEDLMQSGYMGLLKAADNFDFRKEAAFSTYAVYWIKQTILRQICDQGYRIRIPVHMMEKILHMSRLDKLYESKGLEYQKRINQIAEDMELKTEKIEYLMELKYIFLGSVSLDTPVGEEEESTLGEFVQDDTLPSIEDQIIDMDFLSVLNELLSTLKPREAQILRMRYGFCDDCPRTLEEVGEEYKLTRERIRQIEEKALKKLRHPSRIKKIKNFLED